MPALLQLKRLNSYGYSTWILMMKSSSALSACAAAVISGLIWICVVAIGVIENSHGAWSQDIRNVFFRNRSYLLMKQCMLDITPTEWSLSIWEFIYFWNTLWVLYCIAITCRPVSEKASNGESATCNVHAFPPLFHWLWGFGGLSQLAWIFFWDREIYVGSVFFQIFVVSASIGCLFESYKTVDRNGAFLQAYYPWDLWVCRALVQNGITMLCTWSLIQFLINLASILSCEAKIPSYITSLGALGIIGLILLVWFILDTFVLDRWIRYTFSVYPVIGWASLSMLLAHFQPWSIVTIVNLTILGISTVMLIIRVPLVVWRGFTEPLYITQTLPLSVRPLPKVTNQDKVATTVL